MENDTSFPRSPRTSDTIAADTANPNFTLLITEHISQIDNALREPTDINELRQLISKPTFSMPAASTTHPYTRTLLWAGIGVACIGAAVAVLFPASIPFLATMIAAHAWAAPTIAAVAGGAAVASFLQAKHQHQKYQEKKTTHDKSVDQQMQHDKKLTQLLTGLNNKYQSVLLERRQLDVEEKEQEQEQEQEQETTIEKDAQLLSLALASNNQNLQTTALTIIQLSKFMSAYESPLQTQTIIDILQDALAQSSATPEGTPTSSTPDHRRSIQSALNLWEAIKTEKETPSDARQLVGESISSNH